jgi:hypothetical protein
MTTKYDTFEVQVNRSQRMLCNTKSVITPNQHLQASATDKFTSIHGFSSTPKKDVRNTRKWWIASSSLQRFKILVEDKDKARTV